MSLLNVTLDFDFAGRNVLGAGFGHGFDDDGRHGINSLGVADAGSELAKRADDEGCEQCFCFHVFDFSFVWSGKSTGREPPAGRLGP